MLIRITMKTPDCLDRAIEEAKQKNPDVDEEDLRFLLSHWIKWGEYVTIEIDTKALQASVIPVK